MAKNKKLGTSISRYNVVSTIGSGKAGNVRLYQKGDRTYMRAAYNSTVNNPRTAAQMNQRLCFASMSNFYKVVKPYINDCFEAATPYRSSANIFRSLNQGQGVYLTKDQLAANYSLLQPYCVSQGSICVSESVLFERPVGSTNSGCVGFYSTALYLGHMSQADNSAITTWGELSMVLLAHNPQLRDKDVINVCVFKQIGKSPLVGPRRVTVSVLRFIIDTSSTESFLLVGALQGIGLHSMGTNRTGTSSDNYEYDWYLGYSVQPTCFVDTAVSWGFGVAFIVSRPSDKTVSTSHIAIKCDEFEQFLTAQQFKLACDSYGEAPVTTGINSSTTVTLKYRPQYGEEPMFDNYMTYEGPDSAEKGSIVTTKFELTDDSSENYDFVNMFGGIDRADIVKVDIAADKKTCTLTFRANYDAVIGVGITDAD